MTKGFVIETEQHLLGAILSGGDVRRVFSVIDETNFVEQIHGQIFAAARTANDKYSSTSLPVVAKVIPSDIFAAFKTATGIELSAYLAKLVSETIYGSATVVQAAKNVLQQWGRISIAREAQLIAEAAQQIDADAVDLIRTAASAFDEVQSFLRSGGKGTTRSTFGEAAKGAVADSREAKARNGITGITSGLVDLDRLIGGFQRADLTVIGARPSMGKTTLGTAVSLNAAKAGAGVGFFSLEMDTRKLVTRFCSDLALSQGLRLPYQDIINGSASDADLNAIDKIAEGFSDLPIIIEDQAGLTISDIRVKTEAMIADMERSGFTLDLLIIDHLLKIRPSKRYAGNRTNEIGEITDGLKELARECNISVVLLTQLNREVERRDDKRPTLADLRDSGAIEQDADCVMFLHREAYYLEREKAKDADREIERQADLSACRSQMTIDVAKQRNGEVRKIDVHVDMACSAVRNAARLGYGRGDYGS